MEQTDAKEDTLRIRGPRLGAVTFAAVIVAVAVFALFLITTFLANRAEDAVESATEKYVTAEMAANALKTGSDNLTTQVRLYTFTGEYTYLQAYFDEVASGRRENAVATLESYLAGTEAYRYLEGALASSYELMEPEYYAMVLVNRAKGQEPGAGMDALRSVSLTPEDAALPPAGKMDRARELTFGATYQEYDSTIDECVAGCVTDLNAERSATQDANALTLSRLRTAQALLAALLAAAIVLAAVLIQRYVIGPASSSIRYVRADEAIPLMGAYELQYLQSAYNDYHAQSRERVRLAEDKAAALESARRERNNLFILNGMLGSGYWNMDFNEAGEMTGVYWSWDFRHMLGYDSVEEFPNELSSWSDLLHPDDRDRVLREFYDTVADYSGQKTYDVEYRLRTRHLGWRWFHAIGRLSRREDGSPITYVGLFMDITDRRRMAERLDAQQRELEEALEQAQTASQAKSIFLFNMSHDIRTPMNAILGYTALARRDGTSAEEMRSSLAKIETSGQQLLSLLNDILDMSRIESGNITLAENLCDLTEVVAQVETVLRAEADGKGLRFNVETEHITAPTVLCDRLRLGQVLTNLLSNAIKFTPDGGTVRLCAEQLAGAPEGQADFVFRVADTGIGMSPEFVERVFEPFERERTSTASGLTGTGLGLPISKNIVDLMGGSIVVESVQGEGTTVTVTLRFPIPETEAPGSMETETPEAPEQGNPFEGRRVLLVEDNEINREIALMVLEEMGFASIDTAENGAVAVEKFRAAPGAYDLILMDIQMPVMDGYEAARQIRALDGEIPIAAVTANAFEDDKRNAREAGMNAHIAKPLDFERMREELYALLTKN